MLGADAWIGAARLRRQVIQRAAQHLAGPAVGQLIERNLVALHKAQWVKRDHALSLLIQAEQAKTHPDADRLLALIAEQHDWHTQRFNPDVTRRTLLNIDG